MIIYDIFTLLYQTDLVIVDFSGSNPTVMYETGIAHTQGKTVIPIAQNIKTDVPFNLRHHSILECLYHQEGLEGLFAKLHTRTRACEYRSSLMPDVLGCAGNWTGHRGIRHYIASGTSEISS